MANPYLLERARYNIDDVLPVVGNALGQILNRPMEAEVRYADDAVLSELIAGEEFPRVVISFKSGQGQKVLQNVILTDPQFILNFYAWMIMDDPAEEVTEEHFDGLREGLEQVFGQIKMAVTDDNGTFQFEGLDIKLAQSAEDIAGLILEGDGAACTYILKTEDIEFELNHYLWPEHPEQFVEKGDSPMTQNQSAMDSDPVDIQSAEFGDLSMNQGDVKGDPKNVNMLLDVELEIRVEIDRKTILVSDLLKLGKGSIVELDKSAGEALDVYVNGRKFAEGEVVVVDDRFGIRVTQLLSPKDRVQSLGQHF